MRLSQHIHLLYLVSLITAFVCVGCVSQPKPIREVAPTITIEPQVEEYSDSAYEAGDEAYPAGYYIHTVSVPNETISIIAKWYTGKQKNWVILVKCNPTIKPNYIFLGDKIKIPRSIMIKQTKLPAQFVHQLHSKVNKKRTSKAPVPQIQTKDQATEPEAEEEPLFFGPKAY